AHEQVQKTKNKRSLERFLAADQAYVLTTLHDIERRLRAVGQNPAQLLKEAYRRAERATDFVKLARARDQIGFATLLASECGLSAAQTDKITKDSSGFALAICLKSLALPLHIANEAFLLINPALGQDINQFFMLDWFYAQISPMGAKHLVDQWQTKEPQKKADLHVGIHQGRSRGEASQTQQVVSATRRKSRIRKRLTSTAR
ncbi:MAG: hypothetical protein AAFW47_01600, partial [Pseudomonadota bacterium]